MMPNNLPDKFDSDQYDTLRQQVKHSAYLEEHAEHLYETAALLGRLPETAPDWDKLPQSDKARFRFEAEAAINRLSRSRCYQAQLRAREHVASAHYGADFSHLSPDTQRHIKCLVATAVDTYGRVLEGFFTPLPEFRAAELEPTNEDQ